MGIMKHSIFITLQCVVLLNLLLAGHATTYAPFVDSIDHLFTINGQSSTSSFPQLNQPSAVFTNGGKVVIVDTQNHRLVVVDPSNPTGAPSVYGSRGTNGQEFTLPYDAKLIGSYIYVADTYNSRIQILDATTYAYVDEWTTINGAETTSTPFSLAYDSTNNFLYVTDTANSNVKKYTLSGTSATFVAKWSTFNSQTFSDFIDGVAVDASGNVYVVDTDNSQIVVFDSTGAYQSIIMHSSLAYPQGITFDAAGNLFVCSSFPYSTVLMFASPYTAAPTVIGTVNGGQGNGDFLNPTGVFVDASYLYVADTQNNRIQLLSNSGSGYTYNKKFDHVRLDGELGVPTGVAYDSTNKKIFVVNQAYDSVDVFDAVAATSVSVGGVYDIGSFAQVPSGSISTTSLNNFYSPSGISYSSSNFVVADTKNQRILSFTYNTATNDFTSTTTAAVFDYPDVYDPQAAAFCGSYVFVAMTGTSKVSKFTPTATLLIEKTGYQYPTSVICGINANEIVVVDSYADLIYVMDYDLNVIRSIGGTGQVLGTLNRPTGVAIKDNRYWVSESAGNKVTVFESDGTAITTFGTPGSGTADLQGPRAIAASEAYIYVADTENNRVQVYCGGLGVRNYQPYVEIGMGSAINITLAQFFGGDETNGYTVVSSNITSLTATSGLNVNFLSITNTQDTAKIVGTPAMVEAFEISFQVVDNNGCKSPVINVMVNITQAYPFRVDSYSPVAAIPTSGGALTITGQFAFSSFDSIYPGYTLQVFIGGPTGTECLTATHTGDSTINCNVQAGVGYLNDIFVIVNYGSPISFSINTTYHYFSFAPPTITKINGNVYSPAAGYNVFGEIVTVEGTNFGADESLYDQPTIKGLHCTSVTTITPHTKFSCVLAYGAGNLNTYVLNVGTATAGYLNTSVNLNFTKPTVACQPVEPLILAESTLGGGVITVLGSDFGAFNIGQPNGPAAPHKRFTEVAQNGLWEGIREVYVKSRRGNITYVNDTEITITIPGGAGSYNRVWININSDINSWILGCAHVKYPAPTLTHINPARDIVKGQTITVFGKNFGIMAPEVQHKVTIGGYPCTNVHLINDGELTCVAGDGTGSNMPVRYTADDQISWPILTIDWKDLYYSGLSCESPNGGPDFWINQCNCYSGFAPSLASGGKDCSQPAICPGLPLTNQINQYPPNRPTVSFSNDRLSIVQTSPVVHNRRDFNIRFETPQNTAGVKAGTQGEYTCNYPGQIWTKSVSALDCLDEFTASLPWSQHAPCGFVSDTNPTSFTVTYKADLVTEYRDIVITADKQYHQKIRSVSYLLQVSFTRHLTVASGIVSTVFPGLETPSGVEVEITSSVLYDPATLAVVFNFVTTLPWPYQFGTAAPINATYIPTATGSGATTYALATGSGAVQCNADQDSTCEQEWGAVTTVDTGCVLSGKLVFNTTAMNCRDIATGACPMNGDYTFVLYLQNVRVCDADVLDATAAATASIVSYEDNTWSMPSSIFQVGDVAYFQVQVTDPDSSIDYVTLNNVVLTESASTPQTIYPGSVATSINFNYTDMPNSGSPATPGSPVSVNLWFKLNRAQITSIGDLTSTVGVKSVEIAVTLDIGFHGNQKRTITLGSDASSISAKHPFTIVMEDANDDVAGDRANSNNEYWFESAATTTPFVGMAVAVLAVFAALF